VCHDNHCYPASWSDQQIAAAEVFVHGVTTSKYGIASTTVPGPRAYCRKVCYQTTPHFFDVEVWVRDGVKQYQIVLRCEECHHGWDLVTKEGSPTRWRRLMKDATAREMLQGAVSREQATNHGARQ